MAFSRGDCDGDSSLGPTVESVVCFTAFVGGGAVVTSEYFLEDDEGEPRTEGVEKLFCLFVGGRSGSGGLDETAAARELVRYRT